MGGVFLVDEAQQQQIEFALAPGLIVEAGSGEPQKLTLPDDADVGMMRLDETTFRLN